MKKIILGTLITLLILPGVSMAYTPIDVRTIDITQYESRESLEELRKQLLLLLIDLLRTRIQELIALRDGVSAPAVLGVATSSPTVTTVVEEDRRRGSGGGGGSSRSSQPTEAEILADLQQTIADLLAQLNKLEEDQTAIEGLQALISDLEAELAEREAAIVNYQMQITSLTSDIASLEADDAAMSVRIAELEVLNQQLLDIITARESAVTSLEATVAELEQQRDEQQAAIAILNQAIILSQGEIEALGQNLSIAEAAEVTKDAQITALTEQLSDLQDEKAAAAAAHNQVVAGLEADLAAKLLEISSLETTIADLQSAASLDTALIASLQATIVTLESDAAALQTQLSTEAMAHANEKALLDAQIIDREAAIATLNVDLEELRTTTNAQIAELEIQISTLTTELNELSLLVIEQTNTLATADQLLIESQEEITSLGVMVGQLQQQIANLEELVEEQEEIITNGPAADCVLESANLVSGAAIIFCTPTDQILVGEPFLVQIGVDSGSFDISSVVTVLWFDTDFLSVNSITKAGSDYSDWTIEPVYTNVMGGIALGADTTTPLSGVSELVTVSFTPLAPGTTTLAVDATILTDDSDVNIFVPITSPVFELLSQP